MVVKYLVLSKYQLFDSLEYALIVVKNSYLKHKLEKTLQEIKRGEALHCAFENSGIILDVVVSLFEIGWNSSQYEKPVEKIEYIYLEKLNKYVKIFSASLGPLILFLVSLLLSWLIFAFFLPLWQIRQIM
jgi:type II secretory pathway component PulF